MTRMAKYTAGKNIAEISNPLSRVHERYRQTKDGFAIAKSERNVVTIG